MPGAEARHAVRPDRRLRTGRRADRPAARRPVGDPRPRLARPHRDRRRGGRIARQARGKPRAFHIKGPLSGGSLAAILKGLDAELGLDLTSADILGLGLGPAPVVVRCKGGASPSTRSRPPSTKAVSSSSRDCPSDDTRGIALQLRDGSAIDGAKINDEVSLRVLSYLAPVLDQATQVGGSVAVDVQSADIPITGPPDRTMTLTGHLAFQDVVFAPGPAAREILSLVGKSDMTGIRIHQPVQLSVADRRVDPEGVGASRSAAVSSRLEGSVGFDKTLELRATVPITKAMLGSGARLDGIADGGDDHDTDRRDGLPAGDRPACPPGRPRRPLAARDPA